MKKKKIKKILLLLIIVTSLIIINPVKLINNTNNTLKSIIHEDKYEVIKLDENDLYPGVGKEYIENTNGYFSTFTTTNNKVYKEYKQNDKLWAYLNYWEGTMEDNGCGITALAIILSGYGRDLTPADLRSKYYPVLNNALISHELTNSYGILNSDFYYDSTHLSKNSLIKHLKTNRPILICVWNKPNENRWTTSSHYLVLLATDGKDLVYISNPNGLKNSSKSSGWYNFSEITPYIAKALYIESY